MQVVVIESHIYLSNKCQVRLGKEGGSNWQQGLEKAMSRVLNTAAKANTSQDYATSAATRCAVASAALAVLQRATSDQQLEEACLESVKALLDDDTYVARRHAAELAVHFFDFWDNALSIQMWINEPLYMGGGPSRSRHANRSQEEKQQRMETAVLVQGAVAANYSDTVCMFAISRCVCLL